MKKRKERKTAADFLPNFCLRVLWDGFNQAFFPPFIIISIIFLVEWSFAVERWIDLVCVCVWVEREREARGPIRPNLSSAGSLFPSTFGAHLYLWHLLLCCTRSAE